jgi:hypothetical protein
MALSQTADALMVEALRLETDSLSSTCLPLFLPTSFCLRPPRAVATSPHDDHMQRRDGERVVEALHTGLKPHLWLREALLTDSRLSSHLHRVLRSSLPSHQHWLLDFMLSSTLDQAAALMEVSQRCTVSAPLFCSFIYTSSRFRHTPH